MRRNFFKALLLLFLSLSFNSCVLVPFIDAFKQMGGTEEDRIRLFDEALHKFFDLKRMQLLNEILPFVAAEYRSEFSQNFRKFKEVKKTVDFSIEQVEFDEDAKKADVQMQVKYFRIPYYVVQTRIEKHKWKFSSGSWQLTGITNEEVQPPR